MLNESAFRKTGRCVYYEGFLASKKVQVFPLPEVDSNMINESDLMTKSEFHMPFVIKGVSNKLDIKVPANGTTLTEVAEVIGHSQPIKIIEVGEQSEITGKTLGEYANYLKYRTTAHKVINMISLEFSSTPLNAHIHAPKFVREIDWIDNIWPLDRRSRGDYPQVQKYCLSGMATSYTDFHIDFGGTSVWYHVVTGQKRFYLVAPTVRNLLAFQKWSTSTTQSEFFFGDLLENKKECFVYDLHPGDTFMIPSGWIHSVYTPKDSLVFGGNFLHINAILRQLQVYQIEANTRVHKQYRFPLFRQINWYVLCSLLPVIKTMYRTHSTDTKDTNETDSSTDFSQYEDEVVSIARTVRKPSLFNQLPLLVKVAGEWVDSMTDPAEIDIYLATAKDTARCVDSREVLTQWWEVLSALAKTLDADCSASSEVSASIVKSDEPAASFVSTVSMSYAEYVAFLHSAPSPINLLDTATVGRALLPFDAEIEALYAGLGITHHSNSSNTNGDSISSGGGATSSASQSTEHSGGVVTFSQHNAQLSKLQAATSAEDSSLTLKLRHNNLKRTLKLKPDPLSDLNGDDPSVCDSQITIPNTYTTSTLPPEGPSGRKVITTNDHKGMHKRKDDESLTYEETMAQLAAEDGDGDGPEGSDVASDEDDVTEDQSDSNYGGDGGNPAPEEKPVGSSGLRLKFTLSKKETSAGSSTTNAAAPIAPGVTNGFTVPVYTPAASQLSNSIGGNNGVGARSNKSLSLSDYVTQQRGTSSAASTLKTTSYTDNTAAIDTSADTTATDANHSAASSHTAGAANESKRKVTLTLLSANKKRQMAEDAKRGPAPPKVSNTVRIQQSTSGKGNNAIAARIIDESEGQRKYGTRGIKLSATFLQNAMDVDFLDEPQQPHSQGSGASVNSAEDEEHIAVTGISAAESDSQAAAEGGTATNAEALRAEMDFLFADDDSADGDFSEEEAFTEEMLDRRAERAERNDLDNMDSEDDDEDVGFDSGFEEEDEEEALYVRMRGNKRGAPSATRAATVRNTSGRSGGGTVTTAGAKSTNKRRRIDHFNDGNSGIGSLSKPAGRAPTAPPKKEFVVDRVSYNSYMGIAPTAPPIVAATGSFNTNSASVASNARPVGGANSWKPLSAFTASGGATSGAKPVSNRNKILKKLGMK